MTREQGETREPGAGRALPAAPRVSLHGRPSAAWSPGGVSGRTLCLAD